MQFISEEKIDSVPNFELPFGLLALRLFIDRE